MIRPPFRGATSSLLIALLLALSSFTTAERLIESRSLQTCMDNSLFSASLFQVVFTPDNGTISFNINGVSSIDNKNVTATLQVFAYGFKAIEKILNPCAMKLSGMCPMQEGNIDLSTNINDISPEVIAQIPGIAFEVPDLDGVVRVMINTTGTQETVACLEAALSNGKTVDQKPVGFLTAMIAGLGLIASAVTSGLGHDHTAAHVAANAMSLFGYFQSQAMVAMTAVRLPPIVASWGQNFGWAMGIIHLTFMQNILDWYVQATGGHPTNLLNNLDVVSVNIQKRGLGWAKNLATRDLQHIVMRSNNDNTVNQKSPSTITLTGITRFAFKSKIEETNFFLTGLSFFVAFVIFVCLGVAAFKGFCELAIKLKWIHGTKFKQFRNGWLTVLKGIMYRLVLIGFAQMTTLCLWELTVKDSKACVVLAIFFFLFMIGVLSWAAFKVMKIAKKSLIMHESPAYKLYSDPMALNRWGFLYVQFRATSYYFIIPLLAYVFVKAVFIAFGQKNGIIQVIALFFIELMYFAGVLIMKPWMDKRTNIFNISICVINLINSIFLVIFSGIFKAPGLAIGVMGVVFFAINAIFSFVLLILVLAASIYALASKNPETRYQPMGDDRSSFMKSTSKLVSSTELDALGVTARGDMKERRRDLEDDDSDSFHSKDVQTATFPPTTSHSTASPGYRENVDPSAYFPSSRNDSGRGGYQQSTYQPYQQQPTTSGLPLIGAGGNRNQSRSPGPDNNGGGGSYYPQEHPQRRNNNQWHVGAGYDH